MSQITVIVPVYKVEAYIDRCLESILAQSFSDFDLVLVDDGSPDNCPQICDAYAEKDERITVIHKQNGGLSDARNAGIDWAMEHSDSQWLAFVDSDDYLHPDYLKILLDTAKKENADLVICDFIRVNERDEIIEREHKFFDLVTEDKNKLFQLLYSNWRVVPAWNKLYHKHIFDDLRFAFGKIHEDDFAIHHVLWNCRKAVIIPTGLYYYLQRANSIMKTETPKSRLDALEALVESYEFSLARGLLNPKRMSTDYLHSFEAMKKELTVAEKKRLNSLRRRFSIVYFSNPANRSLKKYLALHFGRLYQKAGGIYNQMR